MARRKKKGAGKEPITLQVIECSLRELTEFGAILPNWNSNEKRLGRYSGSRWHTVPKSRYPILAYIDGDFASYFEEGMTSEEIIWACINFLNTPPPRKKFAKRQPKPLYGTLDLIRHKIMSDAKGRSCFQVVLSTEKKKNKHFWGHGL